MKVRKNAQSTFEFLLLVGLGLMAVLVLFKLSFGDVKELNEQQEFLAVQDLALLLRNELILAAQVQEGYFRTINVPTTVEGKDYTIEMVSNTLTVTTRGAHYTVKIPPVDGTFTIGAQNTISKKRNTISITS